MSEREMNGADLICGALKREGARVLFGHPGGAILPLYDALHRSEGLRHVLVRHEQAAAHAADGYARATGSTGVCLATSGPGATNLVTGLAAAAMDSVPLVAITGQVPTGVMGSDAFQETDILGVTMPITKHGFLVTCVDDIPHVIHEAFRLARRGRPGPVLVDVPKDVQAAVAGAGARGARAGEVENRDVHRSPANPHDADPESAVARVAELVRSARRPVLMVGRGVVLSRTTQAVLRLAETLRLPVITTLLGLDAFPQSHPLALGMPGMHGSARANRGVQEADLVLGLGLRFDDRVTGPVRSFAPRAHVIAFEVDPAVVGRTVRPHLAVVGDLGVTLPMLQQALRGIVVKEQRARLEAWWRRLREWSRDADSAGATTEEAFGIGAHDEAPIGGREAVRAIARAVAAAGAQVASDVGQHQMWLAQELGDAHPGTHLTSGGLGAMGYALPAALGAAIGRPDRATWVVAGDGGFQMTLQELATVVQESVPLRIAVVNNGFLGMVRQWQELFYERRYSASRLTGPDLCLLASAYGVPARRVERAGELQEAIGWAALQPGPVLLDLVVCEEQNVYPMVPPGAALHELVEAPVPVGVAS